MNTKQTESFVEFHASGYEVLAVMNDGFEVESHDIQKIFDKIHSHVCEMANAGLSFVVVNKIRDGQSYWLAIDTARQEEIDMDTVSLPTFKDFVAEEVAKYLEIQQVKLVGDENPSFVLNRLITSLRDGDWKRYENVSPDDIRRQNSM